MNISPHLPSEYINNMENPMEIIHEAEKAAEKDIWSLMQYTENLRRQYGKEPHSMEILLKKLYVRRMAADIGITKIYTSGKMVFMKTVMNKQVFNLITDSVVSDTHQNSLVFEGDQIKVITYPYHHLVFYLFYFLFFVFSLNFFSTLRWFGKRNQPFLFNSFLISLFCHTVPPYVIMISSVSPLAGRTSS